MDIFHQPLRSRIFVSLNSKIPSLNDKPQMK
jgi:hypothetical protein